MARIDGILNIMLSQGANELQLGTDRAPRLLRDGAPQAFHMPETSEEMLRGLLGPLFSDERQSSLIERGQVRFDYSNGSRNFAVRIVNRENASGFDVVFVPGSSAPPAARGPATRELPPQPEPARLKTAVVAEPARAVPNSNGPVDHRLSNLLARASQLGASDLHLADGEPPSIRVQGRLRALEPVPIQSLQPLLTPIFGVWPRLERGAVDHAFEIESIGRFRLNLYRTDERLAAAIRLLPARVPRLIELNFPLSLVDLIEYPHGLVLICGATGSGKSTTLAALAQRALNHRPLLLLTLEDPIEYRLVPTQPGSLVRQRQIGRDVPDFKSGLRDALREDPDLILIGEMRDPESIALALTAAETGHLVLASMHSRSATSAIERIVDSYPGERQHQIRVQLADSLRAVVSQRLLPHLTRNCRIPALEILHTTHNVASMIREGKTAQIVSAIQSGRDEGMLPLERCLANLVQEKQIDPQTALAAANDPRVLENYLRHRQN